MLDRGSGEGMGARRLASFVGRWPGEIMIAHAAKRAIRSEGARTRPTLTRRTVGHERVCQAPRCHGLAPPCLYRWCVWSGVRAAYAKQVLTAARVNNARLNTRVGMEPCL